MRSKTVELAIEILDDQKVGEWVRLSNTTARSCRLYGGLPTINGKVGRDLARDFPEEFEISVTFIRRRPVTA